MDDSNRQSEKELLSALTQCCERLAQAVGASLPPYRPAGPAEMAAWIEHVTEQTCRALHREQAALQELRNAMDGKGALAEAARCEADGHVTLSRSMREVRQRVRAMIEDHRTKTENCRRLMAELEKATRNVAWVDRMKDRFLSNVSHELRTPLASIKGFAQALLVEPDMPVAQREHFLTIMSQEAARLGTLIEDMLEAVTRETSAESPGRSALDVEEVLRTAERNFHASHRDGPGEAILMAAPNLPPAYAAREPVLDVLGRLLDNAWKFGNGKPVRVTAEPLPGPDGRPEVRIGVHDEGPGIPKEHHLHLFEKFHRLQDDSHAVPGAGLGLSTVRMLVEREGGRVWVDSEFECGCSFYFTLPACSPGKDSPAQ